MRRRRPRLRPELGDEIGERLGSSRITDDDIVAATNGKTRDLASDMSCTDESECLHEVTSRIAVPMVFANRTIGVAVGFTRYEEMGGGQSKFNSWGVATLPYNSISWVGV